MNYYEHHIGDYDQATAHLSAVEDGIYGRMIRRYMATEKPLPGDLTAVQRLVRAFTREEKKAVHTILGEFFTLQEDGYHQHRCDEGIARYRASQGEVKDKRHNEAERQRRHREERKGMFDQLRAHDVVPPWDASTAALRSLLDRFSNTSAVTPPVTGAVTANVTPPVTRTATATQTPIPNPQSPDTPLPPRGEEVAVDDPPGFFAFWSAWPSNHRKGGKAKCLQTWRKKGLERRSAEVLTHVATMLRSPDWTKEGGQFIPAPLVYLSQDRWDGAGEVPPPPERKRELVL